MNPSDTLIQPLEIMQRGIKDMKKIGHKLKLGKSSTIRSRMALDPLDRQVSKNSIFSTHS